MTTRREEAKDAHYKLKDQIEQAVCRAFCNADVPRWLTDDKWKVLVMSMVVELEPILNSGKHSHKFSHHKGARQPKGTAWID